MTISERLTHTLYDLCKKDLKNIEDEKSMSARVGLIIQALRSAIRKSHVYVWSGIPHFFNGKIYEPIDVNDFKGCIFDVLTMAKMRPGDFTQIEKIQRLSLQTVNGKLLNLRKDIIVFENCVLMLGEMSDWDMQESLKNEPYAVIRQHSPELAQIHMCHFNYDPTKECPRWRAFLESVLENGSARMVLQEFMGCIFIDRKKTSFQQMLILVGNGSNGKGVVSETIRGIVGIEAITAFGFDSLLVGTESLHNIAKMNGKRANWCTEIQALQSGRFNDKLKALIAGEPIECRQLYGLPFTANDIPVMIANCNQLPPMTDRSFAMQRRFVIIRFNKTIPVNQQDTQLVYRLQEEYSGIFNWILEGRQRFIDQQFKFTSCREIDEAAKIYAEVTNNVEEWCRCQTYRPMATSALEVDPWNMPVKSAYDDYTRWCISNNVQPFQLSRFSALMTAIGFTRSRSSKGLSYRIYGEKAMANVCRFRKEKLAQQLTENGGMLDGQELRMGRVYDVGEDSAAEKWHISRSYLVMLRRGRFLDGLWTRGVRDMPRENGGTIRKEVVIYDHIRLGQRLEAYGVYDANDGNSTLSERRKEQIVRAELFNKEMIREGKPFRKLTGKGVTFPRGTIYVDPDWEYTADNAEFLLHHITQTKAKENNVDSVVVNKKGEGVKKTKRQRVAELAVKELTGEANAGTALDEDGAVIEIDINDDIFKVE